jgi:phosphoribosylanthranilate isomerase
MTANELFVKVCGITRLEDALLAGELGAAAIGFIFWPGSPRYISPEDAQVIVRRKAADVRAVGVFVNEGVERVRQIAAAVGLDAVQLHGSETAEYCREFLTTKRGRESFSRESAEKDSRPLFSARVIKAVAMNRESPTNLRAFDDEVVILLDAHDPARHGGTGTTIDWDAARRIAAVRRTILSGGLNAGNVSRARAAVRPYGIDVSSGVESAPGVKDPVRMKSFFEALND